MMDVKLDRPDVLKNQNKIISEVKLNEPYKPFKSNEIDEKKARIWIESKPEDQRLAANLVVENITHIGMEEFENSLKETVDDFNNLIGDEKYVSVIADGKSNQWVAELAWPDLKNLPSYVGNTGFFDSDKGKIGKLVDFLKTNNIKKIAIFDDAIYSGQQVHSLVEQFKEVGLDDLQFIVAVPYVSTYGEERLNAAQENITFCKHKKIESVTELIPDEKIQKKILEIEDFKYITHEEDMGDLSTRTLTYFDHKVPDNVSTLNFNRLSFIPTTIEPYKGNYLSSYIEYLVKNGRAERFDRSVEGNEILEKLMFDGYKIGGEFWIKKQQGIGTKLWVIRNGEKIQLNNGEFFKLIEGDELLQPKWEDWDETEHREERRSFIGNEFRMIDSEKVNLIENKRLERQEQGTTDRLIEFLTGVSAKDPSFLERLNDDKQIIKDKYNLPPEEMLRQNPREYYNCLLQIAEKNNLKIKPKEYDAKFFEENENAEAKFEKDTMTIVFDLNNETEKKYRISLRNLEHELIHGLQSLNYPNMPIEVMEYEAYVAGSSVELMKKSSKFLWSNIFGTGLVGSVMNWYKRQDKVPEWDNAEWFLKNVDKVIE